MNLKNRVEIFKNIVSSTVCTEKSGTPIDLEDSLNLVVQYLEEVKNNRFALYIIGNGGSAAVASHAQIDFLNVAQIKAQVLHEPAVITCMSNDYGYENVYCKLLPTFINPGDGLIAISSSGKSTNICRAVIEARALGAKIITFSGFLADNPLRYLGDWNYWLESCDYGFVEVGHQFILHNLADRFGVKKVQSKLKNDIQLNNKTTVTT